MYYASRPVVLSYAGTMLKTDVQKHAQFPQGAKIFAANHPTTTDPFFVAGLVRQQSFIMINDLLFQVPILGEYLRRSGHIPVKAGSGPAAIDAALEHLAAGQNIIIFPEGALSPEKGDFYPARTGVARLALASGAPVIPIGIHLNWDKIHTIRSTVRGQVEYGRWYLRGPYNVTFGEPLYYQGDVEDRQYVRVVAESVMHHIIELAHESKERMNHVPGALPGAITAV
jgi:1-acyl-sn-glycerol-3-phosphate acyltransferase